MNSKQLSAAISALASAKGYTIVSAPKHMIPHMIKRYPCGWLSPMRIIKFEGRRTGKITYAVGLCLIHAPVTDRMHTQWEGMEEELIDIFTNLSLDNGVISVNNLTIKPSVADLTNHNEISQMAEAEVTIWY